MRLQKKELKAAAAAQQEADDFAYAKSVSELLQEEALKSEHAAAADLRLRGCQEADDLRIARDLHAQDGKPLCGVCSRPFGMHEMYIVDCPACHRFCFDCMFFHIRAAMQRGHMATCPSGCEFQLLPIHVDQVLQHLRHGRVEGKPDRRQDCERIERAYERWNWPEDVFVHCPVCDTRLVTSATRKCTCTECGAAFCKVCLGVPYHYRLDCDRVTDVVASMLQWRRDGRATTASRQEKWFVAPGEPMNCDGCKKQIVGPRFECIHCPSFSLCLACERQLCQGRALQDCRATHGLMISMNPPG